MHGEGIYYNVCSAPGAPLSLEPFAAETHQPIAADVQPVLDAWHRPALFLSASVPRQREHENANIDADTRRYLDDRHPGWQPRLAAAIADEQPRQIARAVSWFCKFALTREYTLVFGGHPAISSMVLEIARNYTPNDDKIRIIIFQSEFYRPAFTSAAKDLARWPHGAMLVTPAEAGGAVPSLTRMRATMFGCPTLAAGVYIGGMSGVIEESRAFVAAPAPGAANRRRYAIGATGGTARFLLEVDPDAHSGSGRDPDLTRALADPGSYPALMTRIFDDLATP